MGEVQLCLRIEKRGKEKKERNFSFNTSSGISKAGRLFDVAPNRTLADSFRKILVVV